MPGEVPVEAEDGVPLVHVFLINRVREEKVDTLDVLPVRDLKPAHEMLYAENPPEFHVIELYGANRPIIIPSAKVEEANQRVQSNYSINKLYNLED